LLKIFNDRETEGVWCQNPGHLASVKHFDKVFGEFISCSPSETGPPKEVHNENWTIPPLIKLFSFSLAVVDSYVLEIFFVQIFFLLNLDCSTVLKHLARQVKLDCSTVLNYLARRVKLDCSTVLMARQVFFFNYFLLVRVGILSAANLHRVFFLILFCWGGGSPFFLQLIYIENDSGQQFFVVLCTRSSDGLPIAIDLFKKLRAKVVENSQYL
jgi:hypothetical protein